MIRDRIKSILLGYRGTVDLDIVTGVLAPCAQVLNPRGEDMRVLYPLSGPDVFTPLLMTNCTRLDCIDRTIVSPQIDRYRPRMQLGSKYEDFSWENSEAVFVNYIERSFSLGWMGSENVARNLFPAVLWQLDALGVAGEVAVYTRDETCAFRFSWRHPLAATPKVYTINFAKHKLPQNEGGLDRTLEFTYPGAAYNGIFVKAGHVLSEFLHTNDVCQGVEWVVGDEVKLQNLLNFGFNSISNREPFVSIPLRFSEMRYQFGYDQVVSAYWREDALERAGQVNAA